jgi:toxin ParE2
MNLKFSIVAEREIQAAADYYETQEAGLGLRFIEELNHTTTFILQFPNAWSPISKRARRCVLRRFPYSVIYSVEQTH